MSRAHSPTLLLLHLHHSSFSNPSFASPTSQALHLIHMASRPCISLTSSTAEKVHSLSTFICRPYDANQLSEVSATVSPTHYICLSYVFAGFPDYITELHKNLTQMI